MSVWNEQNLRADIVSVWGEHGAHADVFDHMLRLIERLRAFLDGEKESADYFVNELLDRAPEHYDDDVAAESIAIRYVRDLEAVANEATALMQRMACLHAYDPECARCDTLLALRQTVATVNCWDPDEPIPFDSGQQITPPEAPGNGSSIAPDSGGGS